MHPRYKEVIDLLRDFAEGIRNKTGRQRVQRLIIEAHGFAVRDDIGAFLKASDKAFKAIMRELRREDAERVYWQERGRQRSATIAEMERAWRESPGDAPWQFGGVR